MQMMDNFYLWTCGDFSAWQLDGVCIDASGQLRLDLEQAHVGRDPLQSGEYAGGNNSHDGSYWRGAALGPVIETQLPFERINPSWNAVVPSETWLEMQVRACLDERWTKWYSLGVWTAANQGDLSRHSISGQADEDGDMQVDTLQLRRSARVFQLKVNLFSGAAGQAPAVRQAAMALSPGETRRLAGDPALWGRELAVAPCSQMVYRDGGEVWCSPTSLAMVLGYWSGQSRPCEDLVRAAVAGVYDWQYRGHGNWPFNVAYAATQGLDGSVICLAGLWQVERLVAAGIPVIVSFAWQDGELPNAPIGHSRGHLAVVVGFDAQGDPIVNDPAAASDALVRRTYPRAAFESVWMASGGVAYLLAPPGFAIPDLS